ncbi:MAG: Hsp70 family protein [Planctomycetaceae bacterium]
MSTTHAVGIDLGTTYSCIAYLNEQGEPVSIPNAEGEISTPSVVLYERGEEVVGTEALRNTIMCPHLVVQNAKRHMGDPQKKWKIEGRDYTPIDVSAAILRKLLGDARRQIGPIERAVITVPAQFSERQRLATVEAGKRAGLARVDIINEPVAAALCYVLGTEGLWFTELASEQRILVYDLGGGTFDLSLVSYTKDQVRVIASTGDLHLGGIDWNQCLLSAVADQFARELGSDPRRDPESLQHLALEVEQCKRSLTVRSRAALIAQHAGKRKTYQIERAQFHQLTAHLLRRTEEITRKLVNNHKRGAAHLDLMVLSTGGSSRMPMVQEMLSRLKGTTVSRALSPDQSIAHGATYYAGMLLTNSEFVHSITDADAKARLSQMKQQSVNARALGILVRDMQSNKRVPHFLIPPNTPLPATATKNFGTVVANQRRVSLVIVESGAGTDREYAELGVCAIDELPPDLPVDSLIAVTISYDESARVTVAARDVTSGKAARTVIDRSENLVSARPAEPEDDVITLRPVDEYSLVPLDEEEAKKPFADRVPARGAPLVKPAAPQAAKRPIAAQKPAVQKPAAKPARPGVKPVPPAPKTAPQGPQSSEIIELPRKKPAKPEAAKPDRPAASDAGEQEFWKFAGR